MTIPTIGVATDHYLEQHCVPRSIDKTERQALRAPREAFGRLRVTTLSQQHVDTYAAARRRGQYGRSSVGDSTVRRELVSLQAALNFASVDGLIPGNPRFTYTKPADGPGRVLWLTESDEEAVLAPLVGEPLSTRLYARMGLSYGVRKGAMMDLRFGPQVDFKTGTVDFHVPGARITRKRRPVVPMMPEIRADLEAANDGRDFVLDRKAPSDFRAYMSRIGYEWVTAHVMKHSAITLMLRGGVPIETVSRITCTDATTISRVYRHFTADELTEAISMRRAR